MTDTPKKGAPKGNQNATKEGRPASFSVRTTSALKGAAKVAAMPGGIADLVNAAVREYIQAHRPDVVERFPEAFRDE